MEMKTPLLTLLITGSLSVLGSCEQSFDELARKAICMFCGDHREIHYWSPYFYNTNALDGWYQWRFSRVLYRRGISRPETTEWITDHEPGVKPPKIQQTWVQCLAPYRHVHSPIRMSAEIGFILPEGLVCPSLTYCTTVSVLAGTSCEYELTCSQDQGPYNRTVRISLLDAHEEHRKRRLRKVIFENLELGASFTVSVEPVTGDKTFITFSTPRATEIDSDSRKCVPIEAADIEIAVAPRKDGDTTSNSYDVNVTWHKPHLIPDFFVVNLSPVASDSSGTLSRNVSGTASYTIFVVRNVKFSQQYNVSIRAWSPVRKSPESSELFTLGEQKVEEKRPLETTATNRSVTIGVTACVSLVAAIGVCAYLMHKGRRWRQERTKSSKMVLRHSPMGNCHSGDHSIPRYPDFGTPQAFAVGIRNGATRKLQRTPIQCDAVLLETEARGSAKLFLLRKELDKLIREAADIEYIDADDFSVEMLPEEEDSETCPHDTSFPPQVRFENELEPRIIHEVLE